MTVCFWNSGQKTQADEVQQIRWTEQCEYAFLGKQHLKDRLCVLSEGRKSNRGKHAVQVTLQKLSVLFQ